MLKSNQESTTQRLIRLESKLTRGFEELGISLEVDRNWLTVDDEANVVYVSTLGRSIQVMMQEMKAKGATKVGQCYEVVHQGKVAAVIEFNPAFK